MVLSNLSPVDLLLWSEDDLPLLERLPGDPAMTTYIGGPSRRRKSASATIPRENIAIQVKQHNSIVRVSDHGGEPCQRLAGKR